MAMDLGQVFTEKSVASYMASLFHLDKTASVLDPCFGTGVFLSALLEQGYTKIDGYEIDADLFEEGKKTYPLLQLYHKDFLKAGKRKKYDGIIMNPPYIRQEKIDDLKPLGISKKSIREDRIYEQLPGTANMYMYFIFKALELLKQDGEMVVIFPSSWMRARGGARFQEALFSRAAAVRQVYLSGEAFEKNPLVEVQIMKLKKERAGKRSVSPRAGNVRNTDFHGEVSYMEIREGKLCGVRKETEDAAVPFTVPFLQYASVHRGITTGHNALYINPGFQDPRSESCLKPIISSPKAVSGYHTEYNQCDKILYLPPGAEMTGEVRAYLVNWEKKITEAGTPKTLYQKIQAGKPWYERKLADGKGILFSYFVRSEMKFIWNRQEILARDNFYVIQPVIDGDLMFALLNNYFTYYHLENAGKTYGAGLLKLQRYDIEELRFPDITRFSGEDEERLRRMAAKLEKTGDQTAIKEITAILAEYSDWSLEQIMEKYRRTREFRLGEGK